LSLKNIISSYLNNLQKISQVINKEIEDLKNIQDSDLISPVASFLDRIEQLASRIEKKTLYLTKIQAGSLKEAKIKKNIDLILNEFNDAHETHVSDFWQEWIPKLINLNDAKLKIVSIELKNEFNKFKIQSLSAINNLSKNAASLLDLCEENEIKYKTEDLTKLKDLVLEIIIESWEKDQNPIMGEKYHNIIRD